jgi:hypothetical protein
MSDGDSDKIQAIIIDLALFPVLLELLDQHDDIKMCKPILHTFGNIASGREDQTQVSLACSSIIITASMYTP